MSNTCARCEKIVYPIEEFKCLDKVWHKGCFKCQGCGMVLNMKTYKGFNKLPYCEAHIPKVKATTMAMTPELKRVAENTKIQSNVSYHAEFEKSKGKFTQVADDPETLRIQQNSRIISNVAYHGELAKKAAMERQRAMNKNGVVASTAHQVKSVHDDVGLVNFSTIVPPATLTMMEPGCIYRAIFDYIARDEDELTFKKGDLVENVCCVEEGWLSGTLQKTGRTGILPASYIEQVNSN